MTWRPTPTVAAFGLVASGGTSICRSRAASARQASRQPSRSSSGENARASSGEGGTPPPSILILHFLQVPWPPQVESMAMPFQLAASKRVTPGGTRTLVPLGWKRLERRPRRSAARSAQGRRRRPSGRRLQTAPAPGPWVMAGLGGLRLGGLRLGGLRLGGLRLGGLRCPVRRDPAARPTGPCW